MIDINSIINKYDGKYIAHYITIKSDVQSIIIMEHTGIAFAKVYWYDDDQITVYLSSLSVNLECRQQGIGLELQLIREEIGRLLKAEYSCLCVDKDSWMKEWYERRGYQFIKEDDDENQFIWLRKKL